MQHSPIIELLYKMVEREASDLYFCPGAPPKFSVHGNFYDAGDQRLTPDDTESYAKELLKERDWQVYEEDGEINVSFAIHGTARFRVNIYTQRGTTAGVIRRIEEDAPSLETLGLPDSLGELIMQERGMILVTGATGSGKSTTIAAMIDYRNSRVGGHIITIEDPIEFTHRHKKSLVTQREVGIDTKSFHIALKNSLRQAPKVIYIGEIRDSETMGFALHAAETGHLVVATLHSTNANQTLERISNFFPETYLEQLHLQLSLNLKAIISQRLVPRKGGGRVAALEIMLNTPLISELIQKGEIKGIKHRMQETANQGNQTFDHHLHRLWKQGVITEEEAFRYADSSNNLRLRMRGIALS